MAASAPPPKATDSWPERQGVPDASTALELGIAHMSLVNGLQTHGSRPPGLSGSSISSAPEEHQRHLSLESFSIHSADHGQHRETPASPLSPPTQRHTNCMGVPKPPGLGGQTSPRGKVTLCSNGTVTSPNFTLTPSPVDHTGEYGARLQQQHQKHRSQFLANGKMPSSESQAGLHWGDMRGSRANSEHSIKENIKCNDMGQEDGLKTFPGLRERSQSSPGPNTNLGVIATSPPVRIDVSSYQGDLSPLRNDSNVEMSRFGLPPDPRRIRSTGVSHAGKLGSRPPLGGGTSQSHLYDGLDNLASSYGDHNGVQRPDNGGRLRSMSVGDTNHMYESRNVYKEPFRHHSDHTAKFGHTHSLGNHVHHNRLGRHGLQSRSISHSGPLHEGQDDSGRRKQAIMYDNATNFSSLGGMQNSSGLNRSISASEALAGMPPSSGMIQRSASLSVATRYDFATATGHRNTDIYGASYPSHRQQQHHHQQRQQEAQQQQQQQIFLEEYNQSSRLEDSGVPVMATPEEMRAFGIGGHEDRQRSQGFSRMPSSQNSHLLSSPSMGMRRHSDFAMGSTPIPMSHRKRLLSNSSAGSHHLDDDLAHPLVGEHIDDPGDDLGGGRRHSVLSSPDARIGMYPRDYPPQMTGVGSNRSPMDHRLSNHFGHMEGMHHFGNSLNIPRLVYNVKFKRTQRSFVLDPRVARDLKIGCYVKVEADRGEDLGIVVGRASTDKVNVPGRASFNRSTIHGELGMLGSSPLPSGIADLKRIIRLATHDEVSLLAVKRDEEQELLKICRGKVRQRGLPMHVVDAEYQFDRHKLTFFFEAEGRIDFRELVRDLFSMYKTRIWMQQLDKNTANVNPAMITTTPTRTITTTTGGLEFGNGSYGSGPSYLGEMADPYCVPSDVGIGVATHH